MGQKIEVFGIAPGGCSEEWLMALYVNPKVQSAEIPAKDCIRQFLERRGCTVISMRKVEMLHHEM